MHLWCWIFFPSCVNINSLLFLIQIHFQRGILCGCHWNNLLIYSWDYWVQTLNIDWRHATKAFVLRGQLYQSHVRPDQWCMFTRQKWKGGPLRPRYQLPDPDQVPFLNNNYGALISISRFWKSLEVAVRHKSPSTSPSIMMPAALFTGFHLRGPA